MKRTTKMVSRRALQRAFLGAFIVCATALVVASCKKAPPPIAPEKFDTQVTAAAGTFDMGPITPVEIAKDKDPSKFLHADHTQEKDKRLDCNYCHGVESNLMKIRANLDKPALANKPPFSGHESCMACHLTEFNSTKAATSGMCVICHTSVTKADSDRGNIMKVFPARYDYNVIFTADQHREHIEYTYPKGDPQAGKKADCNACHQVMGKPAPGVDFSAHTACYACHKTNQELPAEAYTTSRKVDPGALAPGTCQTCHKVTDDKAQIQALAVKMENPRSYQFKFRHADHDNVAKCQECHNLDGTYANQVGVPKAKQHQEKKSAAGQGCFSCHNDTKQYQGRPIFGDTSQSYCIKCHTPQQLGPLFNSAGNFSGGASKPAGTLPPF